MAIPFQLRVHLPKIPLWTPGAIDQFRNQHARQYQTLLIPALKRIAEKETPIGATGQLQDSIDAHQVLGTIWDTEVTWDAPYAAPVSDGSAPHWAPFGRIAQWVSAKLGDPGLATKVQFSIARKGTQPNEYVRETRTKTFLQIGTFISNAFTSYIRSLTP